MSMKSIASILISAVGLLACCVGAEQQSKFTCRDWAKLSAERKLQIIQRAIELAKEQKVVLKLSATYYVKELDALVANYTETKHESGLDSSVGVTLHTIAAMEGDWGNGENKLLHARKWMGAEGFAEFKKQYPEKYQKLCEKR